MYCKYAVTNNPTKVTGTRPKKIPNKKLQSFLFFPRDKKEV
jgi:hypothetical protein